MGDKEEEEDDETIAHLLEDNLEEDEEDAILPPNLFSRPNSATGESPSPILGDLDLIEVCKRAALIKTLYGLAIRTGRPGHREGSI